MEPTGIVSAKNGLNCVAIGGGNGLSTLLSGLKTRVGTQVAELSAIVAVTDDGGSSGRLRDEFKMPPPGDIRNCMVALSEDSSLLSKLFQYRFEGDGDLAGHSFGNLFLAAMCEITGDFARAVSLSSEVLASKGRIYPATDSDVRVAALLKDGSVVKGETNISKVGPEIEHLYLEPADCHPLSTAVNAIREADLITIGPGSLYTSLLPPLLVSGVANEIAGSAATKVFVCNLMTQPGETDGLTAGRHLEIIRKSVPQIKFEFVIVNNRKITEQQALRYQIEGAEQIGVHGSISGEIIDGSKIVYTDLLDEGEKVRHNPDRLAAAVLNVFNA